MFWINGDVFLAHRVVYELIKNKIPRGMVLDHLCRNILCVNPEHLEIVDERTNALRGIGVCAINSRKTHCKRGHEFTEENTRIEKGDKRICRKCASIRCLAFYHNKKTLNQSVPCFNL